MQQLPIVVHVEAAGPGGFGGGEAPGNPGDAFVITGSPDDTDADAFFRADADRLGYLTDPRGMARYFRDHGMLPPRYLEEGVRAKEITGLELDRLGGSR